MRGELANLHNAKTKKKKQKRKMLCTILMKFIVCSCGHPTCKCVILCYTLPHTHTQQPHTQPQAHSEADKSNALGIVNHNQNNRTNEANVAHINNNGNNNAMRGSVCVCV